MSAACQPFECHYACLLHKSIRNLFSGKTKFPFVISINLWTDFHEKAIYEFNNFICLSASCRDLVQYRQLCMTYVHVTGQHRRFEREGRIYESNSEYQFRIPKHSESRGVWMLNGLAPSIRNECRKPFALFLVSLNWWFLGNLYTGFALWWTTKYTSTFTNLIRLMTNQLRHAKKKKSRFFSISVKLIIKISNWFWSFRRWPVRPVRNEQIFE